MDSRPPFAPQYRACSHHRHVTSYQITSCVEGPGALDAFLFRH